MPDGVTLQKHKDVALARMIAFAQEAPGHVVFENSMSPIFRYGDPAFEARLLRWRLPLAYDTSHTFITLRGDNERLIASLRNLKPLVRHYHLVDSMGRRMTVYLWEKVELIGTAFYPAQS